MPQLPGPLTELIQELGRLPGIGPRTAERLALHLAQIDPEVVRHLAQALVQARERIALCRICGALTETQPCAVCADPRRDAALICVVERPVDVLSIEKSGAYRGAYHVLGGRISPVNGIGPEDLNLGSLEERLNRLPAAELILALGSDVEGDATSHYLASRFSRPNVKVSRLAQGLAVGSSLEFTDELTLSRAIEGRRPM